MGQDEKIREAQEILNWAIMHLKGSIIELRKSNGTLSILLHPPHPPLSPDYGGEDKGEGV
jgi:hypothetical protein